MTITPTLEDLKKDLREGAGVRGRNPQPIPSTPKDENKPGVIRVKRAILPMFNVTLSGLQKHICSNRDIRITVQLHSTLLVQCTGTSNNYLRLYMARMKMANYNFPSSSLSGLVLLEQFHVLTEVLTFRNFDQNTTKSSCRYLLLKRSVHNRPIAPFRS